MRMRFARGRRNVSVWLGLEEVAKVRCIRKTRSRSGSKLNVNCKSCGEDYLASRDE